MIPNFDGIYNDTQSVAVNAESVSVIIFIPQCHMIHYHLHEEDNELYGVVYTFFKNKQRNDSFETIQDYKKNNFSLNEFIKISYRYNVPILKEKKLNVLFNTNTKTYKFTKNIII